MAVEAFISNLYCGQQQAKSNGARAATLHFTALLNNENLPFRHDLRWRFFFATNVDRLRGRDIPMNLLAYFAMEDHLCVAFD